MKIVVTAGVACLLALTGCGSGDDDGGLEGPDIGKAKTFSLVGLGDVKPKAGQETKLTFHVEQPEGGPLTRYKTGSGPHTGLHLIIVRRDLSDIIHRHPPVGADGTLTDTVDFPTPGPWHAVADVYPDLGANTLQNFQLTQDIDVGGGQNEEASLPPFRAEQRVGGYTFTMRRPAKLRALKPQFVEVDVRDAQGKPAEFQLYYGALAHAIFFRTETLAYFHTHVCGTGATACAASVGGTSVTGSATTPGHAKVGMLLPSPGTWELFLQVKVGGKVLTAPYTLDVTK